MNRLFALVLACVFLLSLFSGCSSDNTGEIFRFDIDGGVDNLDPQFATDSTARMIIANIYEGLLLQEPDGTLSPGVAESYTVSPNGLTYTFQLRQNTGWADDGAPVTAHDFVFAFRRLFNPQTPSPYASDFAALENSQEVLRGDLGASRLGVRAQNDYTLTFTLSHRSPLFLELLASTAAMPCNQEYFENSRGRYGLELEFVYSNGPFELTRWNNEKQINLRANEYYASERETLAGGVNLYIGRTDTAKKLFDGDVDLALIPYDQTGKVRADRETLTTYDKTVWCLVFNQGTTTWGNVLLRQALAYTADHESLAEQLPANFQTANVFVPPAILLGETPFRDLAPAASPLGFDLNQGKKLFSMGLDMLEVESLPTTTILVPETDNHPYYVGLLQQGWQKNLSAYLNIEPLPVREVESRLQSRDYQILLFPFSPASPKIDSLFSAFSSGSSQNYFGYRNPIYDGTLEAAIEETTLELAANDYIQAEKILLADAVILPVYFETTYYATGKGVEGIEISPYGGKIYFKYATKG